MFERLLYGGESVSRIDLDNAQPSYRTRTVCSSETTLNEKQSISQDSALIKTSSIKFDIFPPFKEHRSQHLFQPSFFQPRALAGLAALLLTVCCSLAALAILIISDAQPIRSWPIQPTVYLAIVAAITNSGLRFARSQAVSISWWYHAARGASIGALERHWNVNQSLVSAILYSRRFSLLNLASIATAFVIIDGVLLQRSSRTVMGTVGSNITINVPLSPEVPTSFSGFSLNREYHSSADVTQVNNDIADGAAIAVSMPQCQGACVATVRAPGLVKTNCSSETWPISKEDYTSTNATWGTWKGSDVLDGQSVVRLPAFYVNLAVGTNPSYSPREIATLTVGRLNIVDLHGSYIQSTCNFTAAIFEYQIQVKSNTMSLLDPSQPGRFVALANNTKAAQPEVFGVRQPITIDGITIDLEPSVTANASAVLARNAAAHSPAFYALDPSTFDSQSVNYLNSTNDLSATFRDPTPSIISDYNQMMFRAAVLAASWPNITSLIDAGLSVNQTVQAHQVVHEEIFQNDLRWFAAAAVLELITVILILPMFYGWWTLGPNITLSPMQIALAFDSPLLADVNSTAGARGVVEEVGGLQVRFGAVTEAGKEDGSAEDDSSGRLGVGVGESVVTAREGMRFRR